MDRSYLFITILSVLIISSSCNRQVRYIYKEDHKHDTILEYHVNSEPYRLKPNDILHINIVTSDPEINSLFKISDQNNDMNRSMNNGNFYLSGFNVNDSGYVELPVLGKIAAQGKTVPEFRSDVTEKIFSVLNEAIVDVKLVSFKISFLGEIMNKGSIFIYQDNIDILEAVSRAGGITDYGNMTEVTVVRQKENKRIVYKLDLTKRELLTSNKFYLYPDDIIIVDPMKTKMAQMNLRDYFFFFSIFSSTLTTTAIVISLFKSP